MSESTGRAELLEQLYCVACGEGHVEVLDEVLSDDFSGSDPDDRSPRDREAMKRAILELRAALPDVRVSVEQVVAGGHDVAVGWRAEGTFTAPLRGLQPTGRRVEVTGITIHHFDRGRIAAARSVCDLQAIVAPHVAVHQAAARTAER
jgi:predicted ester cyclase